VRRVSYQGAWSVVDVTLGADPEVSATLLTSPDGAPAPGTALRLAVDDGWVIPA
jgi:hypothetical protein